MKINLVCFGKPKTPGFAEAEEFFQKRIRPWAQLKIHTLKPSKVDQKGEIPAALKRDGELIKKAIENTPRRNVYLLTDSAKSWPTETWAKTMEEAEGEIAFVIGSSYGFSPELYKEFPNQVSFGRQTFSQGVIRVALLEQIYRGLSVVNRHPYHHA